MKTRYKLTNQNMTTFNNCQWKMDEWKETTGTGELCTSGWLHCYTSPELAVLLNPIHAKINNPRLFLCEVDGNTKSDHGLKEGWSRMRLIKELELPKITPEHHVAFGILCVKCVCFDDKWNEWANNWLSGKDRSCESSTRLANLLSPFGYRAGSHIFAAQDTCVSACLESDWFNMKYYSAMAVQKSHLSPELLNKIVLQLMEKKWVNIDE